MCGGEMIPDVRATADNVYPEDATQTVDMDDCNDMGSNNQKRVHINLSTFIRSFNQGYMDSSKNMVNLTTTHLASCIGAGSSDRGTELISISWLLDAVSEQVLPTDLSTYILTW